MPPLGASLFTFASLLPLSRAIATVPLAHQDTVSVSECVSLQEALPPATRATLALQGLALPSVCAFGTVNLCTQDVDMYLGIDSTVTRVSFGDGSLNSTSDWADLPVPTGDICDTPQFRLSDAAVGVAGFSACLEVRITCLVFFPIDVVAQCFDVGQDTSTCDDSDWCSCTSRPECGWCSASDSCTRLLPMPGTVPPTFSDQPVCSCAGGLLTQVSAASVYMACVWGMCMHVACVCRRPAHPGECGGAAGMRAARAYIHTRACMHVYVHHTYMHA